MDQLGGVGQPSAAPVSPGEAAPIREVEGRTAPVHADVLLLITRLNIGGPGGQVLLLAKGLSPEFATLLAAGTPPAREGELTDPAVPVRHVPLVRPVRPATDLRALTAVRRLVGDTKPRVLHTHMAKAGTIGRLAVLSSGSSKTRPRLVHTFHGHVLEGYFAGSQQKAFVELERRLARRTDVLVAVSPEVRDELVDLGVGKPSQYRVIPLGLDLAPFLAVNRSGPAGGKLRAALGLGGDVPLVGILGRLVPIKDHATLFSAVATIPEVHLAVLGDGELRQSLEGVARQLGIADRTHFTGWWGDAAAALADLDVVALSSRNEGTPAVLIEALAAGRPVVATDVGGVRHVVQDSETGWLCSPGDSISLAALLERALSKRDVAQAMAEEGRRRVAERFGRDRMIADHMTLYQELLGI
ncbi:MAG TPA: glycosyltransferase [Acidimicrobiales bacterium]|nr:glycosyltransferase [Acidimicrobiales bacterium]